MKTHIYFLDEDRPEIELDCEDLVEDPMILEGFLFITFKDKSIRAINTNLISEITTG